MNHYTDKEIVKILRHQNEELKERLVDALNKAAKFDPLFNMFTLLKDGFVMMRDEYKRLQNEHQELPTWEQLLKKAAAKSGKPLPLEGERSNILTN